MKKPDSGTINLAVVADRLELALALPERVASWHALHEALAPLPAPAREAPLAGLRARRPKQGFGAFLAATMLDSWCADAGELGLASRVFAAGGLPPDAGMALLNLSFARALRESADREGLARSLRLSRAAHTAAVLGQSLLAAGRPRMSGAAGVVQPTAAATGSDPARALRRVALVCPVLSSGFHAPTAMALRHACLLVDSGLEVKVFSAQESLLPRMSDWLGAPRRMALEGAEQSRWPRPRRGTYDVRLPNLALSVHSRWRALLAAMARFAPDVCLFVGAFSPLLWPMREHWPVVGIGTNAVAPLGPLDIWLAPDDEQAAWGEPLEVGARRTHAQRIHVQRRTSPPSPVMPATLGVPEGVPIWLTSGSRLASEMRADWRALVLRALERHPTAHWVVVRAGAPLPDGFPAGHPRIHVLPYQTDLAGLMLGCRLHLNPPRLGGGQTVAMAMAHGLPTLALRDGDGGDKVGEDAVADLGAYAALLDEWTTNPARHAAAAARQRLRFERVLDIEGGLPLLLEALGAAVAARPARTS